MNKTRLQELKEQWKRTPAWSAFRLEDFNDWVDRGKPTPRRPMLALFGDRDDVGGFDERAYYPYDLIEDSLSIW